MATKTKAKKATAKKKSAVKPAAGRARPAASRPAAHPPAPPVRDARPEKKLAKKAEKKPVRRPALPDLEIDPDVLEFIAAIDRFKKEQVRPFPTWSEILHILRELGYRKR